MERRDSGFSIERRRFLADLFNIPPMLLGIVTVDEILQKLAKDEKIEQTSHIGNKRIVLNFNEYECILQNYWDLHHVQSMHPDIQAVALHVAVLQQAAENYKGSQKEQCYTLLSCYYQVLAMIFRDLGLFDEADSHIQRAVEYARLVDNHELLAISLYRRGVLLFDRGRLVEAPRLFYDALRDFQEALSLKTRLPALLIAVLKLKEGHSLARIARTEYDKRSVVQTIDEAGALIRSLSKVEREQEIYALKTDLNHYHIDKGAALIVLQRPDEALDELNMALERSGFKRRNIYRDILLATAALQKGEFLLATTLAEEALVCVKHMRSEVNVQRIARLYSRLKESPYGNEPEVTRLGYLLRRKR
jgi:tetratricopeptide (TPR) repeat protein